LDEFERDRILGFLVIFSLCGMIAVVFEFFGGEGGGFEDDDLDNSLL
jgi:hypothetical protein